MTELRSISILNKQGDVIIVWTAENDDEMEQLIKKKMKEGITFFIIEPTAMGFDQPKKTELKNYRDAFNKRSLSIEDEDFAKFIADGKGEVVKRKSSSTPELENAKVSKDSKEVAKSQSVGVRNTKGG